ncbi:Cap protein [Cyclovirus Equ1]|uniref:Cap protein n=1 Tax=Cyclovirus Equ1 TaxID=1673638 RepID=A0A0H4AQY4_9CIRC|nr:Cap protein [Cyclovirus Equ1]AKN50608.1 Cap protein [Cyclovirus Equ1]
MAFRRRRTYRRRLPRRPRYVITKRFRPRYQRQRYRTRKQLNAGDKYFTRMHYSSELRIVANDPSTYSRQMRIYMSWFSNFIDFNQNWSQYKVHKIVMKFTPMFNNTQVNDAVGNYAVAVMNTGLGFGGTDENSSTIIEENRMSYEQLVAIPSTKIRKATKAVTLVFKPKIANTTGVVLGESSYVHNNNLIYHPWISTLRASTNANKVPQLYGAYFAHQGTANEAVPQEINYMVDVFAYVTFKGYRLPVSSKQKIRQLNPVPEPDMTDM